MERFVAVICLSMGAFFILRETVKLYRGDFSINPIFNSLDMTRRKSIARFYSFFLGVFGVDILFLSTQTALHDSAESFRKSQFVFLLVATVCLFAWFVVGRFWFRKRKA